MDYKKAFYSKLDDCYLGVKIKDFHQGNIAKSGFSNLLKIKEQYFAHIKAYLDSQIAGEPQSHDIYNKLFTFFDSYLNESGTPFFNDTPAYKNIYAKVYSNSKDTSLFYKTQNLYYVKSDTLYQSLTLTDDKQSYEVFFDASEYKQNADNTKNKIIFKFAGVGTNDEGTAQILIKVSNQKDFFPELNNVFKQNSNEFSEEFLKDLKQDTILKDSKIKINEEELKKIFRSYKKQAEIDFFIHKNATAFLKEQFDLWMFGYLYKESAIQEWNPEIIAHLQHIKNIAYEVIKLIGDFENELKAVWLKPKFAKKVEYVFSLDKLISNCSLTQSSWEFQKTASVISDGLTSSQFSSQSANLMQDTRIADTSTLSNYPKQKTLIDFIINDKGFESQVKEWQELNLIDENFDKQNFLDFCHSETALAGEESKNMKSQQSNKRDISHFSNAQYGKVVNCHSEALHSKAEESKNNKYCYLPIDTKHFSKETKYKILSSFENVESLLNGELIKSDNFQALNTIMPKYQGKVDLIYIDPPYNTGNDGFIYADNFNHASWLSMINNRLELSKELLNDKGSMFISIDDKEQARLKLVCDEVFGEENFVSNVIWQKKTGSSDAKNIANIAEYILCYAKEQEILEFNKNTESHDENRYKHSDEYFENRGKYYIDNLDRGGLSYSDSLNYAIECPDGSFTYPNGRLKYENDGWIWKWGKEKLKWGLDNGFIEFRQSKTKESGWAVCYKNYMKVDNDNKPILRAAPFKNLLTEVMNYHATQEIKTIFDSAAFDTPKPEKLLKRILEIASKDSSIVLDFFAGSGTTLAVAQKLGRKWLGVEIGEHFYNVIIPRLKKVIAGFQSGISKECDYKGSGAFRYYELESYEEALNHCEYVLECKELQKVENKNNYKGKDYAKCEAILDYRKSRKLIDKLSKGESVCLDMHTEYREGFDIFHTMANLMRWKIKRLFLDSKGIESCEFDNGEILNLDSLDLAKYPKLKNLIWWETRE